MRGRLMAAYSFVVVGLSQTVGAFVAGLVARAFGVRWAIAIGAVAMLAGENGSQIAGQKRTIDRLKKAGYPAQFWVMKGAGHHYSADIDTLMAEAMTFVLSAPSETRDAGK